MRSYSQGLIAKNKAPVQSWAIAMFSMEDRVLMSWRRTNSGSAFCCLLFDVFVEVVVAAVLLQNKDQQFSIVIKAGICPLTMPEGLSHVVNGGLDPSFSQGIES